MTTIKYEQKNDGSFAVIINEAGNTIFTDIKNDDDLAKLWKDFGGNISNRPALFSLEIAYSNRRNHENTGNVKSRLIEQV